LPRPLQPISTGLAEIDFSKEMPKGVVYNSEIKSVNGVKCLYNDSGYEVLKYQRDIKDQNFKITCEAATTGAAYSRLGIIISKYEDGKWKAFKNCWDRKLYKDEFLKEEFKITRENIEDAGEKLMVSFYRCNKLGTLLIKNIRFEKLEKEDKPTVKTKQKDDEPIFPPESMPHLDPPGTGDTLPLDFMPLGVYVSDFYVIKYADKCKLSLKDARNELFAELKELGCNCVYYGAGLYSEKYKNYCAAEIGEAASKYGLRVIIQLNDAYFNKKLFENNYIPNRINKYLPYYSENKDIWAWSPCEEASPDVVGMLATYRKMIWDICPKARIYELCSVLEEMRAITVPYPNVLGIDRYPFMYSGDGRSTILWTPNKCLSWYKSVIRPFFETAQRKGLPCVAVLQGTALYTFYEPDKMFPFLKGNTVDQKKTFFIPETPGMKYHEELDKFGRWGLFTPAENGMRAMGWTAVSEGAKGIFVWCYSLLKQKDIEGHVVEKMKEGKSSSIPLNKDQKNWENLKLFYNEVAPYEKLLLELLKLKEGYVSINDRDILYNSFKDKDSNIYIILVNTRIAEFDGNSPEFLEWPKTQLTVDDFGRMINYKPAKEKEVIISVLENKAGKLFSLNSEMTLKNLPDGSFSVKLEPGQGTILFLGNEKELGSVISKIKK